MKKVHASISLLAGGMLCAASVQADVIATSDAANYIDAPASVVQGAFQDNSNFYVFNEKQNYTLMSDLAVDWTPSDGASLGSGNGGSISAGTRVNSYFLHFDPSSNAQEVYGQIDFSEEILAVIYTPVNLENSDGSLGAAGTEYGDKAWRGYEGKVDLDYSSLVGPNGLWVKNWANGDFTDQARVITAAPVPVPAALWLFGSGILAMLAVRRNRKTATASA